MAKKDFYESSMQKLLAIKAGVQYQNDLQRFYLNQRINSMIGNSYNVCKDAEGIHRKRLDAIPLGRPHILYDAIGSKFIIAIIR